MVMILFFSGDGEKREAHSTPVVKGGSAVKGKEEGHIGVVDVLTFLPIEEEAA